MASRHVGNGYTFYRCRDTRKLPTTATPPEVDFCRQWRRIVPDPVLLFRYSALTLNGHRIHYDRRYSMEIEHYPGLVVHGPLIATLLLDLLHRKLPSARVNTFTFRSLSPLFDTTPFDIYGKLLDSRAVKLWATNTNGELSMEASATIA